MAHVSISDDDDVTGLRNGCLNALVHSRSGDTALLEQVILRHTQWLSSVDVWWNSLTWYREGGEGGREEERKREGRVEERRERGREEEGGREGERKREGGRERRR